jgi:hypothetical protein
MTYILEVKGENGPAPGEWVRGEKRHTLESAIRAARHIRQISIVEVRIVPID